MITSKMINSLHQTIHEKDFLLINISTILVRSCECFTFDKVKRSDKVMFVRGNSSPVVLANRFLVHQSLTLFIPIMSFLLSSMCGWLVILRYTSFVPLFATPAT